MLEWRLRVALADGRWAAVLDSIERMPAQQQLRERWRYWRARALAALDRPDAAVHYAALAGNATYFGFLAADRLGSGYGLCHTEITADAGVQRRLRRDAEFHRAVELFNVDLDSAARWTWLRVQRRLTDEELQEFFADQAQGDEVSAQQIEQFYRQMPKMMDRVKQQVLSDKVYDLLLDRLDVQSKSREEFEEEMQEQQQARQRVAP